MELHPRVSIERAIETGRARLRHRRLLRAAVGARALAAGAALALALPITLPASAGHHRAAESGSYGKLVRGAYDASYLSVKFGWLPPHTYVEGGFTSPGQESAYTAAPHGDRWTVTEYALCHITKTGRALECKGLPPLKAVIQHHGPVIDGHQSIWFYPNPGSSELAWQYGKNAWAVLAYQTRNTLPDLPSDGVRIARGVKFGQHVSLRYAARFMSLPRGWRIVAADFQRTDRVDLATGYQIARLRRISPLTIAGVGLAVSNEPAIDITPQASGDNCGVPRRANAGHVRIHGYLFTLAIWRHPSVPGENLCGTHADGLFVWIDVTGTHLRFPPTRVMERLQLLGPKAAHWVTTPMP